MPVTSTPRSTIAVVLAGGSGTRFGSEVNKVLVPVGGRPVLAYSLTTFERCNRVDAVVIVARAGDEPAIDDIVVSTGLTKVAAIVPGGPTRQGSEWAGLQAAATLGLDAATVLLHDAARPFLTLDLLDRILDADDPVGTIPTTSIDAALIDADGRVEATGDLMRVQTPQAFPLALLLDVFPRAETEGFAGVDTAETVQRFGSGAPRWVLGDPRNIKVTHPDDRARAETLAQLFDDGRWLASATQD